MKRLLLLLGVLVIALPFGLYLVWDAQTRALGNALVADFTAQQHRTIKRTPAPLSALHDNGYQCLGSMLDVTTADFEPFSGKTLDDFITGQKPISELPPPVRERMLSFSPWAASMRNCGSSMHLSWVDGLSPWAEDAHPRSVRLTQALPALIAFTALELRVLVADGQPEVALERCTATWALVADQSHLSLLGGMYARLAVRRLAPACGEALAAVPPEVRTQLAQQWAALRNRLAPVKELIEADRLGTAIRSFAWVSSEAVRSQLPSSAPSSTFMGRLQVGRTWRAYDQAMRQLSAVAELPAPERLKAAADVDAIVDLQFAKYLSSYEETFVLLELLADLAAGGGKPLPVGVTRTDQGLTFASAESPKLLIPIPK